MRYLLEDADFTGAAGLSGAVAVLTPAALARHPLPAQALPGALRLFKPVHFCRADTEPGLLYGTLSVPLKNRQAQRAGFSFALRADRLLFFDESGFARAHLAQARALHQDAPDAPRALCDFLDALIHNDLAYLLALEERAARLETVALGGEFTRLDGQMLALRKELSAFSHYYLQLSDLLTVFEENAQAFFPKESERLLALLSQRVARLEGQTRAIREYLVQIREVYQAQIGLRQNEIMKLLTVITAVFLPLTLITGWYGMNFERMPELHARFGYPAVAALCAAVAAALVWFFKKKKFW